MIQSILLDFYKLKVSKKWIWIFNLILFVSLVGFRYKLGGDTFNYMRDFEDSPYINNLSSDDLFGKKYSPLWIFFFSLIKSIWNDFVFFQLIHALFVNCIVFWFIGKYAKYVFTCILFYFFFFYLYFNTEILRESISICIFLLSVPSFIKKNWIKYFLIILLSILFHYSALVLLIFPLFRNMKIGVLNLLLIITSLYIIPEIVLQFLPPVIKLYYDEYVMYGLNIYGYLTNAFYFLLFPLLVLKLQRLVSNGDKDFDVFITIFFVITIYSFLAPSISMRFYNYLIPISTIYFIDLVGRLVDRKMASSMFLIVLLPSVFFYQTGKYFADRSDVIPNTRFYIIWHPYTSVFTKDLASQKNAINLREKWVDAHFVNLVEDLKELL